MRNSPLISAPVPDSTDVADVPTHLYNTVTKIEQYTNMIFASASARDAAFTAASVTPVDGMKCFLSDTKTQQTRLNGLWTSQEPVVVCTSGTRPTATHTGMQIYETDTKLHKVWDGAAWDGADNVRMFTISSARAGSPPAVASGRFLIQAGSQVVTTSPGGIGTFSFPSAFPSGCVCVIPISGDSQAGTCTGFGIYGTPTASGFSAVAWAGAVAMTNASVRCDYIALGW